MSERSNETLKKDIRDLAEMLLAHPQAGPIIRDAGVRRAFTEAEDKLVMGIAKDSPMMEMFPRLQREEPYQCNIDGWDWNSIIAIGLGRQIADGLITSVDAPEAVDLIERNHFPSASWNLRREHSKTLSSIRISFKLYHKIIKEFIRHPDFEKLRDAWRYDEDGDPGYYVHRAFCEPAQQHQYRYGEIGFYSYGSIADDLVRRNLDIDDEDVVWADRLEFETRHPSVDRIFLESKEVSA
jgi:hypothetical protein